MDYIIDNDGIEETKKYMDLAAKEARKSTCTKSQRGAIIVKDGKILGKGYNKPLLEELCNPCIRQYIKDNSRVEICSAIHAEQMAILDALKAGKTLDGSRMYHIKVKDGEMKPSGDPSCTVCSRMILESEIAEVVLWHKEGYAVYKSKEFNEFSFNYFLEENTD